MENNNPSKKQQQKDLFQQLSQRLAGYQTDLTRLQVEIREVKEKAAATEVELKKLQSEATGREKEIEEGADETIGMLKSLLTVTDKLDIQFAET
ncbi:MAG: hypothetical protein NY202_03065 [Mollicutes bacterium UO1]